MVIKTNYIHLGNCSKTSYIDEEVTYCIFSFVFVFEVTDIDF